MKKTNEKKKNIKLFLYTALLVMLVGVIVLINKINVESIDFIIGPVSTASFSGIITVFVMLVSLIILTIDNKKGFAAVMVVNSMLFLNVFFAVFALNKISSITGVPMSLGILGVLILQHNHLLKIEQNEKRLSMLSSTDPLTGLNNRRSITGYINELISEEEPFCLLFFDIDDFKNINDTMGHACGDSILCETAKRWSDIADDDVYISRIGGDEFAMIVSGKTDSEVREFADKCLDVLSDKIHTDKCDYYTSCSIGSARFPQDGKTGESLFQFADTAMYKAKNSGKNQICFFDSDMLSEINKNMKVENLIRDALKYNRFYLVFQPQFETDTKHFRGFEALLRLKDDAGNPIPPMTFIPVAEKNGLILDIDRWVLRHAMLSFSEQAAHSVFTVSVNISAKHITDRDLASEIKSILDETGFPPEQLEIEVTESCFISSVDEAIDTLSQIKALGVKIALDDFGTGYASLSYLHRLPIDLLKIDKSFIDDMTERNDSGDFVKAIISIGHMFGCKVISEGVELDSQLNILKELKCDYIQGYIWGKPQERSEAAQLIEV